MSLPIYTVGYGNVPIDTLLEHLERWGVAVLVDVRSQPYSRRRVEMSKHALAIETLTRGLEYRWLGETLGGRPRDPDCLTDGEVDYAKVRRLPWFREAIRALLALAAQRKVALLCAEERPEECHRALLLSPALLELGANVLHITSTGGIETHDQMLARVAGGQRELFRPWPPPLA